MYSAKTFMAAIGILAVLTSCNMADHDSSESSPDNETPIASESAEIGRYQLHSSADGRTFRIDTTTGQVARVGEEGISPLTNDTALTEKRVWEDLPGLPAEVEGFHFSSHWIDGELHYDLSFDPMLEREATGRMSDGQWVILEDGEPIVGFVLEGFSETGVLVFSVTLDTVGEPLLADDQFLAITIWLSRWTGTVPCSLAIYRDIATWKLGPKPCWECNND